MTAAAPGVGLVVDPSGAGVGLPLARLEGSPFETYLVPGLILLLVLGVVPLVAAYGVWRRRPWAWRLSFVVGVALMIWLAVQIWLVGYYSDPPLQPVYACVGVAIAGLAIVMRGQEITRPAEPSPPR